jgi:8-oxo-dGTP pyrophosphatase MutT (NUDIX family)
MRIRCIMDAMSDGKTLKSGVHVVSVAKMLIINERDEVLVLTIGEYKEHPEKSYTPDLPGGMIEILDDESEKEGVIREAKEETGISLNSDAVFLVYTKTEFFEKDNESTSRFLYAACLDHTPEVTISWEHDHYEWVAIKDLLATKKFRSFYQEGIEYAFENKLL